MSELWEPERRAGRGRGGAVGGPGAGAYYSRAAGGLVESGHAVSGNGHVKEQGRHARGLGKQGNTGNGETRWGAECVDEMSRAEQATGEHTDYIHGRCARQGPGTHTHDCLSRANPQCLHLTSIRSSLHASALQHVASLGVGVTGCHSASGSLIVLLI